MNKYALLLALPLTAAGIAGCASDIDSNYYSTGSVGQVSQAQGCTVVSVRPIKVSTQNGAGTAIGGIAGGIAGSQIGGGNTAHLLGAVGGAILGGFAGNVAQEGLTSQQGYEYIVRLDNGNTVSTTQGADVLLNPGQRCQIIFGNPARIIPN
uniref:glycine zipper 2TM domain-containing protein n=1 Tax=Candidatus Scatocola faecipullorum TaxID=2840917 RepID=UPI004028FC72